jgi:two-component system cell cycle sensor histidine kinase/response regulator CckA
VANDVTRARQLEEQYRQAQKMEAIGQLAGGIAHDFNNLLSVIMGSSSLMLADEGLPHSVATGLEEIRLASERAASLTRQLLVFSRRETIQAVDLDLNELVVNVSKLLTRVLGEDVSLALSLAPCALPLHADTGMLEQVVMNLAVNARDAMPEGGELRIETQLVDQRALPASLGATLHAERYALLRVRDTGCGIPHELQARIFEPFFTTKPQGKGTGLGLATLYSIVRRHHGAVDLRSEPGSGASFSVYLPCAVHATVRGVLANKHPALTGSGETILVVEDDDALRNVTINILTRQGYRVLAAENGPRALDIWREHADEIRLLLTDLVMPGGITGSELARRLAADSSGLKIVYTSGYSDEIAGRELSAHERFLPKPFTPRRLAEVVRACLSA